MKFYTDISDIETGHGRMNKFFFYSQFYKFWETLLIIFNTFGSERLILEENK